MLDWDSTQIVFTKRTLIEFLKYTGTTVDTNFGNIQKLPRYAKFGKMTEGAPAAPAETEEEVAPTTTAPAAPAPANDFKPTRRVRELPGGARTNIFGDDDEEGALSAAPPKQAEPAKPAEPAPAAEPPKTTDFVPSRRVREAPGGNSSVSSFWGGDEPEEFKPTRRVRQAPGGGSSGIF
nr:predicted protein [Mycena chlorophos]